MLVKQLSHATSNTSTVHRITYRVSVEGLPVAERSQSIDVSLWDRAIVGEPLQARYLPSAPDSVQLLPAPSVLPFATLAAAGGLASAIGIALVVSGARASVRAGASFEGLGGRS